MQCAYVYKKGALKNQQCSTKPYNGLKYCHKHKKYNSVEKSENNETIENVQSLENNNNTEKSENNENIKVEPQKLEEQIEVLTLPRPEQRTKKNITFDILPESYDSDKEILDKDEYHDLVEKEQELESQAIKIENAKELQIKKYYREIPFLSQELPLSDIEHLSSDEKLERIQSVINCHGIDELIRYGFRITVNTCENIGIQNGFNFRSATNIVMSNEKVHELLKIIRIQNDDKFSEISPTSQLMFIVCSTFLSVHLTNSALHDLKAEEVKIKCQE